MVLLRFFHRAKRYGIRRIFSASDFLLAISSWVLLIGLESATCDYGLLGQCFRLPNEAFVGFGTNFSVSLAALILAGVSILIAFSDDELLADLKELGIYSNILFVFQYTLYLAVVTSVIGSVITSYGLLHPGFYAFLFFFAYTLFAVISLIEMLVTFGNKKARYELNKSND